MRCLDPINYFLVPNKNNSIYKIIDADDGSPLGENKYVVRYMLIKAYERFGKTFEDFLKQALVDVDINDVYSEKSMISSKSICVEFGMNINFSPASPKYSYEDKLKVAAYYFRNRVSLTKVEENVLHLFNKLGFVAKDILNSLGVNTGQNSPHKGMLIKLNIADAIKSAVGTLKKTLEDINANGL